MAGPTWDSTFRTALADRDLQGLRVAVVLGPTYSPSLGGPAPTADIAWRNYGTNTATQYNCLGSTCRVSGASLDAVRWSTTADQLTVEVVDEAAVRAALNAGVHRGTVVEVRVTLPGDNPATGYYRVWIGRVQNLQSTGTYGGRTSWTLTAYGVQSLMQTRRIQTGTAAGSLLALLGGGKLFYDAGLYETYITPLAYTVGDANLNVNDTTNFSRETGGTGCIELDDGTNRFYLTYTGRTATTFTGLSATGMFGTTAANMAAGGTSIVRHIPYVTGHPLDILRKIIQSTGAGTNGTYDTLPGQWGLSISDDLVNNTDIGDWKTNVVNSSVVYHLLALAPVENTWAWLSDWLSRAGVAVVQYEGQISVRCAQDITDPTPIRPGFNPVDGAIERATWSLADSRNTFELVSLHVDASQTISSYPAVTANSSMLYTTPGGGWLNVHIWDLGYGETGDLTRETDIDDRRWHWSCGIAERVDLEIAHLGPAVLAPGDLPVMTSALVFGVDESSSSTATYSSEDVLVVDGPDVDWLQPQGSRITVLRYRDETPPE